MIRVVQCWDDGVEDDLRVIEILRKHGAKASFNLNFGLHGEKRAEPWRYKDLKDVRRLAKSELRDVYAGVLVSSHTLTHPFLTRIPIDQAKKEILDNKAQLEQHFGYAVKGFAYPFGDYNDAVMEIIREAGHVYARTTRNDAPVYPPANPMHMSSHAHFLAPDFWARFENAAAAGDVFYFWGHSYEIVTEADWQDFDKKIARLAADPRVEFTDLPTLFE
jgi:peptidoglycan/xylan/chitin deacetylase (PgdA/CDA1 family)